MKRFLLPIIGFKLSLAVSNYDPKTYEEHRASQHFFQAPGGKMAYLDLGRGKPLLLVHGIPTSSWLYRKVIQSIDRSRIRVIAPDLLGYGNSEKPIDEASAYTIEKQAERLLALMEHLQIDRWAQACHDVGGVWTWEILAREPERIEKLIIFNTFGYKKGFKPPVKFKPTSGMAEFVRCSLKSKSIGRGLMRIILRQGLFKKKLVKRDMLHGYWFPVYKGGSRPMMQFFSSFDRTYTKLEEYARVLPGYRGPAMIIWGKRDKILLAKHQIPRFKRDLSILDTDIHIFKEAKHFIQEEHPEAIGELIENFVLRKPDR